MYITYSDGLGLVTVEVNEYGITCDGGNMYFSDTENRDYNVPCHNVFSIQNEQ